MDVTRSWLEIDVLVATQRVNTNLPESAIGKLENRRNEICLIRGSIVNTHADTQLHTKRSDKDQVSLNELERCDEHQGV